jgi:hypothetical protein
MPRVSLNNLRLAVLLSLMAAPVAHAEMPELPIHKGEPLSRFNEALLSSGWTAVSPKLQADGTPEYNAGQAGALFKAGYVAIEICAVDRDGPCIFNYVKQGKCLQVYTSGEYGEGREPALTGWAAKCREND